MSRQKKRKLRLAKLNRRRLIRMAPRLANDLEKSLSRAESLDSRTVHKFHKAVEATCDALLQQFVFCGSMSFTNRLLLKRLKVFKEQLISLRNQFLQSEVAHGRKNSRGRRHRM